MKLKKLTIHNIASIENATIDFTVEPLADSELFLITGNTGSGKSTILDAICLALYATTPRMKNLKMDGKVFDGSKEIGITDTIQLMRRNTKEAFARLSFVGTDGNEYEAEWSAVRKTKNIDRRWKLTNLTHPEASPDEGTGSGLGKDKTIQAAILTAVGLDFNQFCRTTMLAQGEFTRFLNSGDKEKAEILEKVTGTAIYSRIGAKVYEITSAHEKAYREAKDKIANVQTLSEEQIAEKKQQLESISKNQIEVNQRLETENTKQKWLEQETTLTKQKLDAESAYNTARQVITSDAYRTNEQTIRLWDATTEVRTWLNDVETCKQTINEQSHSLQQSHSDYLSLLCGLASLIEKVKEDADAVSRLEQQIQADDRNLSLDQLRERHEAANTLLANLRVAYERLKAVKEARKNYELAIQNLADQKKQIDELDKAISDAEPKLREVQIKRDTCKQILDRQKDTVNSFAKTMRGKLHVGDKCPICGQIVQLDIPHEDEWQKIVNAAQTAFDDAEKAFSTLSTQVQQSKAERKALSETYATAERSHQNDTSVRDAELRLSESCQECHISVQSPLQLQDVSNTIMGQGKAAGKAVEHLKEVIKLKEDIQTYTTNINLKKKEIQLVDDSFTAIEKQMPAWKDDRTTADITPCQIDDLSTKLSDLQSNVASSLRLQQSAKTRQIQLQASIKAFMSEHSELQFDSIVALCQVSSFSIQKLRETLTNQKSVAEQKKTLYQNVLRQIEEHQQHKPTLTEGDTLENIRLRIANAEQQVRTLSEQVGAINQELKLDEQTKQLVKALMEEAEAKKQVWSQWARLNELIGDKEGTKFRKIAQGYILAYLVKSANVYMQRLTNRYTLHSQPGQFVIMVEDAYQGYVSRPASTISGGESFLVSLALALALSDIGQSLRVETLFIDEGFGTLSGEPLLKAIETLQSLRKHAGRQVGIISHIEEVRNRIPVQIQVQQEGNNSYSTVSVTNVA